MTGIEILAIALAAFGVAGSTIAFVVGRKTGREAEMTARKAARDTAEDLAKRILGDAEREAEGLRKQAMLAGKEEAMRAREEWEGEARRRRDDIDREEKRLQERESVLDRKFDVIESRDKDLGKRASDLGRKEKAVEDKQAELDRTIADERRRLEQLAGLSAQEAKSELMRRMEEEAQAEGASRMREIRETAKRNADREARKIVALAVQRIAAEHTAEITASAVSLPKDDMKGRIIGREGRNIKAFEAATGVTLLIDESPQLVLISSFDPVRREVARGALEGLVKDGRIHPASIEEFVKRAQEEIDLSTQQAGEEAVQKLGVNGLHPQLVRLLGRLKYRFSYSQNALDHSVEVGFLASIVASELGLDPAVAKRSGLLHDIGKGVEGDYEGSHAHIGAEFARRYGESPVVVNAIAAHHAEVNAESLYAGLVILADTVSAVRPGARAESMASYLQRLERLEKLAMSMEGVQLAYAIQAGREIRVVVAPQQVSDERAREIAKDLRRRIEEELQYPSTIKITVIRESRFSETAT